MVLQLPLIILFQQHGADQRTIDASLGNILMTSGRAASPPRSSVQAGLCGRNLAPALLGEVEKGQYFGLAVVEEGGGAWKFVGELVVRCRSAGVACARSGWRKAWRNAAATMLRWVFGT